jgi:hypothetical protein
MLITASAVGTLSKELLLSRVESEMRRWMIGLTKPMSWLGDAIKSSCLEVKQIGMLRRVVDLGVSQTTKLGGSMRTQVENGTNFFQEGKECAFDTLEDFTCVWEYMILEFHKLFSGMEQLMKQRHAAWPTAVGNLPRLWMDESSIRHSIEVLNDCVSLIRDQFEKDSLVLSKIAGNLDKLQVDIQWTKHSLVERKERVLLLSDNSKESQDSRVHEAFGCLEDVAGFCTKIESMLSKPIKELGRRRLEEYNRAIEGAIKKFTDSLKCFDVNADMYMFIRSHSRSVF